MIIDIIAPILYFKFDIPNSSINVFEIKITDNKEYLHQPLSRDDGPNFLANLGRNNYYHKILAYPCLYYSGDTDKLTCPIDVRNEYSISDSLNHLFHIYFLSLWFVKDNSASTDDFFWNNPQKKGKGVEASGTTRKCNTYSNSAGNYQAVSFSSKELERADIFLKTIIPLYKGDPLRFPVPSTGINMSPYNYVPYNNHNRLKRSIDFLIKARFTSFLPTKISMYMAVLESLFNTEKYKKYVGKTVQARASTFLGSDVTSNREIIKQAYNARSEYIHGQIFKTLEKSEDDREKLINLSKKVDNLIREILTKAIEEPYFQANEKDATRWIDNTFKLSYKNTFTSKDLSTAAPPDPNLRIYTHEYGTCNKSFISNHNPKHCPFCGEPANIII